MHIIGRCQGLVLMAPPGDSADAKRTLAAVISALKAGTRAVVAESFGGRDEPVDTLIADLVDAGADCAVRFGVFGGFEVFILGGVGSWGGVEVFGGFGPLPAQSLTRATATLPPAQTQPQHAPPPNPRRARCGCARRPRPAPTSCTRRRAPTWRRRGRRCWRRWALLALLAAAAAAVAAAACSFCCLSSPLPHASATPKILNPFPPPPKLPKPQQHQRQQPQALTAKETIAKKKAAMPADIARGLARVSSGLYIVAAAQGEARSAMVASWVAQARRSWGFAWGLRGV